jgi:hypothetical protein
MGDDWEIAKGQLQLERDKLVLARDQFEMDKARQAWVEAFEEKRLKLDKYEAKTRRMAVGGSVAVENCHG